jgi:OmpA family
MYILEGRRFGETPPRSSWRARLGVRPKPASLRFMNLDQFNWNDASLTARLQQMIGQLAQHVRLSWQSMQPIGFIRLIGHTDNTGPEQFNVDLGNRRAQAVKEGLENILREDILRGRIRIAILVEPSLGSSAPTADNRTREGRAGNRRVEVFVAPPEPSPAPKPPPPDMTKAIEDAARRIEEEAARRRYNQPVPTLPGGKSLKQFVDGWLSDRRVPKWVRNQIWDAIFGKNFGLMSSLLNAAGISGSVKDAFVETVRGLVEVPRR